MRSDTIKKGPERAPHRSLLEATGVTDADMSKPFIADAVETMIEAHRFDGMICLPNCDATAPGSGNRGSDYEPGSKTAE